MAEFRGYWRPKPGSIMADGAVVGTNGVRITRGTIWIDNRRLPVAERFGWKPTGDETRHLVQVSRA